MPCHFLSRFSIALVLAITYGVAFADDKSLMASATVSISVYLEPAAYQPKAAAKLAMERDCAELLQESSSKVAGTTSSCTTPAGDFTVTREQNAIVLTSIPV